jgi:hypothetical protein
LRRRLILTGRVPAVAPDPGDETALLWNPAGATFAEAWAALNLPRASLAVIGGTDVFGMFLPLYDVFYLTRAPNVRLPGGRPVFPQVPDRTPEEIMASHGLVAEAPQMLDAARGLAVVSWRRSGSKPA